MTATSKKKVRFAALVAMLSLGLSACSFPVPAGLFGGPGAQYCEWRFFEPVLPTDLGIIPGVPREIASSRCTYGL